ncbi:TetR/AcrR family transcriptional regulator [Nocardia fluminea]|uniref:TetR/AcrR family transcriptional regulator n=1 Tax=Nocardia fluminea TaxID=134984 RepID=UPI00366D59A4
MFRNEMRQLLRARVISTTRNIVCTEGWGAVRMSRLAKDGRGGGEHRQDLGFVRFGIGRSVLYTEIGTKLDLADALIANEIATFLTGISNAIAAEPDNVVDGLAVAAEYILRSGADNPLLNAALGGCSAAGELCIGPMTVPGSILWHVISALTVVLRDQYALGNIADHDLGAVVEAVIRLTLSNLFLPTSPIDHATQIALVTGGTFGSLSSGSAAYRSTVDRDSALPAQNEAEVRM